MDIEIASIGRVHSPQTEAVDEGWGELIAEIHLEPSWAMGLTGLEGFSHAWIACYLHDAQFVASRHLCRHPREDPTYPKVGIFAQRARHRPNRIGITACPIVAVDPEAGVLTVQGLDAIDGTPVLDIKPYVAAFDRREATIPRWLQQMMEGYF